MCYVGHSLACIDWPIHLHCCIVAHSGSIRVKDSLEIASRTKMDSLKSILNGVSLSKLGGIVLVETLE